MLKTLGIIFSSILLVASIAAQTTSFTYQGKLTDSNLAANGPYDMQFRLTDANGASVTSSQTLSNVQVTAGVFTVTLDFGAVFDGSDRYLEIGIRPGGNIANSFTVLAPKARIMSAPYAIKSAEASNALALGGTTPEQFVRTNDARLTDSRSPLGGSSNYIQNSIGQQAANFNITGTGTANFLNGNIITGNIISANDFFSLNNFRVLSTDGNSNLWVGYSSGSSLAGGTGNSFFGQSSGASTTVGTNNAFFGAGSGNQNDSGGNNSFFGFNAGNANVADGNSFFGSSAGANNTSGTKNAFFGWGAGFFNITGLNNSYFGYNVAPNANGSRNSVFGSEAGGLMSGSGENSLFGYNAGNANVNGFRNSMFGADAGGLSTGSNNVFVGYTAGNKLSGDLNTIVGSNAATEATAAVGNTVIGSLSATNLSTGSFNTILGRSAGQSLTTGTANILIGSLAGNTLVSGSNNIAIGNAADITAPGINASTAIGFGATVSTSNSIVLGTVAEKTQIPGTLTVSGVTTVGTLGVAGATQLCRNASNQISTCSSSLRYKTDIANFDGGLSMLRRLRPISFSWREGGLRDVGFGAEEVAKVDDRLVVFNEKGEVEGVKYDRLTTVLVNAVREQQDQIDRQRAEIDALRALVCADRPDAEVCKEKKK